MYIVYLFLKVVANIALWIYFPRTKVKHRERLRFKGPAIVVSNHPNTLMDVLNTAARAREQFYFLANSGLFKSKFGNWFFNTFYCIPIERLLDTNGKPVNNAANFARIDEHLRKSGTLFIAPEGFSWMERHLHPIKTGTARIAFSAESKNNYQLDLKIVPVGLNYSSPMEFRSRLFVNVGDPLYARDFQELYAQDQIKAVRHLTALLEERLRPLMIDTRDEAEDELVKKLEEILQNSKPLSPENQFNRTKNLIEQLRTWQSEDLTAFTGFRQELDAYFSDLKKYKVSDNAVASALDRRLGIKLQGLIFGFPLFLYGFLNHLFPTFLPALAAWWLVKKQGLYIGYTSTIKFSLGLITIPLFYWLQSELMEHFFGAAASWWYLASLPLAGWFALIYQPFAKKILVTLRLQILSSRKIATLRMQRVRVFEKIAIRQQVAP